jgi:hypothetical protein
MMYEFGVRRGGDLHFQSRTHARVWIAWSHLAEAAGHKRPKPDEIAAIEARFPATARAIRAYVRSCGQAGSDAERREIIQRVKEPLLAEIRRMRAEPTSEQRLARLREAARSTSRSARKAALKAVMGWK